MESAGLYDITVKQNSGFTLPMRYEAPEGSPVDFTGSTARMQVRAKVGAPVVLLDLSTTDGTITLGSDGSITLSETALTTAALRFSKGVYDLRITPPVGEPYYLLAGNIFLERAVTHS